MPGPPDFVAFETYFRIVSCPYSRSIPGAASAAVDACDAHPKAAGVARQLCLFARNAVCRTPETREAVLQAGVESKLREAQTAFPGKCKDVAHAALRDLAL